MTWHEWMTVINTGLLLVLALAVGASQYHKINLVRSCLSMLQLMQKQAATTDATAQKTTETMRTTNEVARQVAGTVSEAKSVIQEVRSVVHDAQAVSASQSGTNLRTLPPGT